MIEEPTGRYDWLIYLNDTVSLLRAEGHPQAHHYPICKVWNEAKMVQRRMNLDYATQATSMLMAVGTAQTGGKNAVQIFSKYLEKFSDGS
jgi:hypothetical protein